jgi:formyl-CoA transferase
LADFGADVIKVEMPNGGDPSRGLGPYHDGEPLRWYSLGRNKRSITLDLHKQKGIELFLSLVTKSDVVIENFRTGTLAKWGLDYKTMKQANPKIVVSRVTGYGQTGPKSDLAGFGTPATAFSGMTYVTGYKDRPPVNPSFSLADYICGLYTAMSTMMALYYRDVQNGEGQEIDLSLYEGIFRMMESHVADYHKNGLVRERTPSISGSSSPGGTYETQDGKWVVLVCSTERTWEYLTKAMKRPDLLTNPLYLTMRDRVTNEKLLNEIVKTWVKSLDFGELKATVDKEGVPVNLVYNIKDIFNDPHYLARKDIIEMPHPRLGTIKMPGIVPKFSLTPGVVKWVGPELGAHNEEVYQGLLGLSTAEIAVLKRDGVI